MIFVIGGAGYIGSHVLLELALRNEKILVIDNLSTGSRQRLVNGEKLEVVNVADAQKMEELFAIHKPHSVFDFAAFLDVGESVTDPIKYYENNTVNVISLLQLCKKHGVKNFIFSSTAAVYGDSPNAVVNESSDTNPINPYGSSKLMSERIIQDVCHSCDMKYGILRYFNVAGADPKMRIGPHSTGTKHLIKKCFDVVRGVQPSLAIYGTDYATHDGTGVRDYIHVSDLAHAHLVVLEYLETQHESQIFNVGYQKGYSVKDIISVVEKVTGCVIPTIETARRPGDCGQVIADSSKLKKLTGWKPQYQDLYQIVSNAWNWEQKQHENN